jgi:hypothetical protein
MFDSIWTAYDKFDALIGIRREDKITTVGQLRTTCNPRDYRLSDVGSFTAKQFGDEPR